MLARRGKYLSLAIILSLALVFLVSCGSEDLPTSTAELPGGGTGGDGWVEDPSFISGEEPGGIIGTLTGLGGAGGTIQLETIKEVEATTGGEVKFGFATLDFDPDALGTNTTITVDIPDPTQMVVDLGPEGIKFNRPVTLTFDLSGTSKKGEADDCKIAWYNPAMQRWEYLETRVIDANTIEATLEHFSKYGGLPGS